MSKAEKVTVRFGIRRWNGVALQPSDGGFFGMPDPFLTRETAIIPPSAASWSFALNAFDSGVCGVPLVIPKRTHTSDGPVTAISIAPDSPIESVDLYLAGKPTDAHRIAPGAPFVGEIEDNATVLIVPNRPMPVPSRRDQLVAPTISDANALLETAWWDVPAAFTGGIATLGVPARLVLHRGTDGSSAASAIQKRARYTAPAVWQVRDRGGAVPTVPSLIVIVDGRRRIRVEAGAWNGNAPGASLHVWGMIGHSSMIAAGLSSQLDLGGWDELLAATVLDAAAAAEATPTIFDYNGNPYYAIECRIEGGAIGDTGYLTVHAWDD